jgi:hypothetical protein
MVWDSSTRSYSLHCPGCIFPWIMEPFVVLLSRVSFSLLKDIIYVIIILYLWHLVICEHFCSYVWNKNVPGHICDEYSDLVWNLGLLEKFVISLHPNASAIQPSTLALLRIIHMKCTGPPTLASQGKFTSKCSIALNHLGVNTFSILHTRNGIPSPTSASLLLRLT